MTISTQQKNRAQRQWLRRRQTAPSSQANQPKALPSWLNKAEREKFMTLYTQKIIEHIYGRNTFYPQLYLEKTEKSLLEQLLQQRLLQHKQLLEQNRHQQKKLKAQTSGLQSKSHASATHRARHERKRYRHQPR